MIIKSLRSRRQFINLFIAVVLSCAGSAHSQTVDPSIDIVWLQPFELAESYVHTWSEDRPLVRRGYFLALDVDPAPSAGSLESPVLYVDGVVAELVNFRQRPSRIYALVPTETLSASEPLFIWFGSAALPERVSQMDAEQERMAALERGVGYMSSDRVKAAAQTDSGGSLPTLDAATKVELLQRIATSVLQVDMSVDAEFVLELSSAPTYELPPELLDTIRAAQQKRQP